MQNPYLAAELPDELPSNPMHWAEAWLREATEKADTPNPNSMTLATVADDGSPSARIVLCKKFDVADGYVVFFTNYRSRKAAEIARSERVALVFHFDRLGRQVRMEGYAVRSPAKENDEYFRSRPRGSQLGAWGSDQSAPIASREALLAQVRARAAKLDQKLGAGLEPLEGPEIPRPPHWGGFRVWPDSVELWIAGAGRVHERAVWKRSLEASGPHRFDTGPWSGQRLQP